MNHHTTDTASWTSDELTRMEAAQELEIAPMRRDGTLRKAVPIWVVRAGEDLYVRAAYGPGTGWHRVARASHEGRIRAGGVEKDVTIEDIDDSVNAQVDAAYRTNTADTPGASSMASPTPRRAPRRSGSCRSRGPTTSDRGEINEH